MKVLLIRPPTKDAYLEFKAAAPEYPPLSVAYIAAVLEKAKHEVKIIDLAVEYYSEKKLKDFISSYEPQIIGFTAVTPNIEKAYSLVSNLKKEFKNILFVIGGPHVTALPSEALQYVDIVVRGEGEHTMLELVNFLSQKKDYKKIDGISFIHNKKEIHNKSREIISDVDSIPYPARHLLPLKKYGYMTTKNKVTNIIMSRGCPHRCNYCNKNIFGLKIRGRSVKNIIGEIDELVNNYDLDEIHISDDTFNYDRERTMLFCEEVKKKKYNLRFFPHAGIRVHNTDAEQFRKFKEIGIYAIAFGVESGNQQILNNIRKGITLEQVRRAFKLAHKANFEEISGYFMLGLKGETLKTARDTINFAIELNPTIAKFHVTVPYPGTEYYNELKDKNRLRIKKWSDYAILASPTFVPENISVEQLINLQKEAYRKYFYRPKAFLNVLNAGLKNKDRMINYIKLAASMTKLTGQKENRS